MNHRIYSDFNGLQKSIRTDGFVSLYLHYWGTLKDLSRLQLKLFEGMRISVYSDSDEKEDLEATGTVYYDRNANQWFTEFSQNDIKYVPTILETGSDQFLCWSCQKDLSLYFKTHGLSIGDICPNCDVEFHEILKPPL